MANEVTEELKDKIVAYFEKRAAKKKMFTIKDVARGARIEKSLAKKAVSAMTKEGRLEFTSYGGATYIKLSESEIV